MANSLGVLLKKPLALLDYNLKTTEAAVWTIFHGPVQGPSSEEWLNGTSSKEFYF